MVNSYFLVEYSSRHYRPRSRIRIRRLRSVYQVLMNADQLQNQNGLSTRKMYAGIDQKRKKPTSM